MSIVNRNIIFRRMNTLFIFLISVTFSASAIGMDFDFEGFLQVGKGREIFARYRKADDSHPTYVFFNGLTHSTDNWLPFLSDFSEGDGFLLWDMWGQGQTIIKSHPPYRPIHYSEHARDLESLILNLNLPKDLILVGLSYGAAVAVKFAEQVNYKNWKIQKIIGVAPFTQPLESLEKAVNSMVNSATLLFPLVPINREYWYDYFLFWTVFSTFPWVDENLRKHPYYIHGVYDLVRGARDFDILNYLNELPNDSLNLIVSDGDEYIDADVFLKVWENTPGEKRGGKIILSEIPHDILKFAPNAMSVIVQRIAREEIGKDVYRGEIVGSEVILTPKESCKNQFL